MLRTKNLRLQLLDTKIHVFSDFQPLFFFPEREACLELERK